MTNNILSLTDPATVARSSEVRTEVAQADVQAGFPPVNEQALRIANRLLSSLKSGDRILACASIRQQDPCATFVMYMGLAFIHMGHGPVLVVDASLTENGQPAQDKLSQPRQVNLRADESEERYSIRRSAVKGLDVLSFTGGFSLASPALSSTWLGGLFDELRNYKLILIDAGPVLESTASLLVASEADAIVAVASSGNVTRREVVRLKAELALQSARFLGVVLTDQK
jgi:Mrp family chromosome partitioning ATPase